MKKKKRGDYGDLGDCGITQDLKFSEEVKQEVRELLDEEEEFKLIIKMGGIKSKWKTSLYSYSKFLNNISTFF